MSFTYCHLMFPPGNFASAFANYKAHVGLEQVRSGVCVPMLDRPLFKHRSAFIVGKGEGVDDFHTCDPLPESWLQLDRYIVDERKHGVCMMIIHSWKCGMSSFGLPSGDEGQKSPARSFLMRDITGPLTYPSDAMKGVYPHRDCTYLPEAPLLSGTTRNRFVPSFNGGGGEFKSQ